MLYPFPSILALFDVGGGELFMLAFIALLLYGGELPKVARKVGRIVGDLKRQADGITREWRDLDMEDSRTMQLKKPPSRIPPPKQEPVTPTLETATASTSAVEPAVSDPPTNATPTESSEPQISSDSSPPPKPPEAGEA